MLSVTRHTLSLVPRSLSYRVSIRANGVNLRRRYHKKVSALPFVLSGDEAIRHVAPWASAGVRGKGLFRSLSAKYLPGLGLEPLQPDDLQAVYMPVWFIDGEVTVRRINEFGGKESVTIHSLDSYMPGFYSDPLSTLSFYQLHLEEFAIPFTPELRQQHGLKVSCLQYSISPVPLQRVVKSLTTSRFELPDSTTFDGKSIEISMLAAYPVLLPVYLMKYYWNIPAVPEKIALTLVVQAHSKDGLVYFDAGTKAAGGLLRENLAVRPGSMKHKLTHAADNMPIWDRLYGKAYGFSNLAIPSGSLPLKPGNIISEFMDEKMRSKYNMTTLARHGVNMDHPCVRMYTKEELETNRRFLAASSEYISLRECLDGISLGNTTPTIPYHGTREERIRSDLMKEMMLSRLRQELSVAEKNREKLKPQWLRDLQGPRGRKWW